MTQQSSTLLLGAAVTQFVAFDHIVHFGHRKYALVDFDLRRCKGAKHNFVRLVG